MPKGTGRPIIRKFKGAGKDSVRISRQKEESRSMFAKYPNMRKNANKAMNEFRAKRKK